MINLTLSCQSRFIYTNLMLLIFLIAGVAITLINQQKISLYFNKGREYDQRGYTGWNPAEISADYIINYIDKLRFLLALAIGILCGSIIPQFYIKPCLTGLFKTPTLIYFALTIFITMISILLYHHNHHRKHIQHAQTKREKFDAFMTENSNSS